MIFAKLYNKAVIVLSAICIFVVSSVAIFFMGKRKGKTEAAAKQKEEVLNDVVKTKEAIDKRSNDSIDVVRERVRKHNRD